MHVVLVEPEIPQNAGSIARCCAATNAWLHLVQPYGFILEDRYLKRAGLDYWPGVRLSVHASWSALEPQLPAERTRLYSARATKTIWSDVTPEVPILIFGRESTGLPTELTERWPRHLVRIPTTDRVRSLNVATAVGIASYEVLRRSGFSPA